MAYDDNSLTDSIGTASKAVKVLDKLGLLGTGDAALGTGNILTASHAAQGGSTGYAADAIGQAGTSFSGAGLGTALAGGAFAALAGFVATKLFQSFTEGNPSLNFQGKDAKYLPLVKGGGRDGVTQSKAQFVPESQFKSDKFDFSIGVSDLPPEGDTLAKEIVSYLDNVFTEIQANTDVDINKIIPQAFELTDWENGGPQQMLETVVNNVATGIKTGQPLSPFYAKDTLGQDKRQYATGTETYDYEQEAYDNLTGRVKAEAIDPSTLHTQDRKSGDTRYTRVTYAPIEGIEGDDNFVMPDITKYTEALATGTQDKIDTNESDTIDKGDTVTTSTEDSTYSFNLDEDLWGQFLNIATTDLQGLIQANADFTADEATQKVDSTKAANDANSKVLESLRSDLVNEEGTFTPTQTSWGNYQPGTNFIKAKSLMSLADKTRDNALNTTAAQYDTIADRAPSTGTLQFLAALQDMSEKDKTFVLDKYRADKGLQATQYKVDAQEPGTLSNIVSTVNAGKGVWDLGSTIFDAIFN